jgi:hypothetical protein
LERQPGCTISFRLISLFEKGIYLILPAALGPEVNSASERNEYQEQEKNGFGE